MHISYRRRFREKQIPWQPLRAEFSDNRLNSSRFVPGEVRAVARHLASTRWLHVPRPANVIVEASGASCFERRSPQIGGAAQWPLLFLTRNRPDWRDPCSGLAKSVLVFQVGTALRVEIVRCLVAVQALCLKRRSQAETFGPSRGRNALVRARHERRFLGPVDTDPLGQCQQALGSQPQVQLRQSPGQLPGIADHHITASSKQMGQIVVPLLVYGHAERLQSRRLRL